MLGTSRSGQVVLDYVCPALGVFIAALMCASPAPAVLHVSRARQIGDLNPIPFAMMVVNSAVTTIYGYIISDYFVYSANMPGLLLGLWYVFVCYKYAREGEQNEVWHVLLGASALVWILGVVDMAALTSDSASQLLWGSTSVSTLALYYTAPLSTLARVVTTRNASSLHWPLCLMNVVNGCLWFAYGLAINNWFVAGPNGAGVALNTLCLALCVLLPHGRRSTRMTTAHVAHRWAKLVGGSSKRTMPDASSELPSIHERSTSSSRSGRHQRVVFAAVPQGHGSKVIGSVQPPVQVTVAATDLQQQRDGNGQPC